MKLVHRRSVQCLLPGRVSLLTAALVRLLLLLRKLLQHRLLKHGLLEQGLLNRIYLEREQATQLSCSTAYRATQARLSENATERATQRLADLSEQVAEESLRRELLHLLLIQLLCIGLLWLVHWFDLEVQKPAELSSGTADRTA